MKYEAYPWHFFSFKCLLPLPLHFLFFFCINPIVPQTYSSVSSSSWRTSNIVARLLHSLDNPLSKRAVTWKCLRTKYDRAPIKPKFNHTPTATQTNGNYTHRQYHDRRTKVLNDHRFLLKICTSLPPMNGTGNGNS